MYIYMCTDIYICTYIHAYIYMYMDVHLYWCNIFDAYRKHAWRNVHRLLQTFLLKPGHCQGASIDKYVCIHISICIYIH